MADGAARYRAWGKRKQKHAVVRKVVEVAHKPVDVTTVREVSAVRTEPPVLEELLRRIRYDPNGHKIVYRDPDTHALLEITRIPDVAVDFVRYGRAKNDELQALAQQFITMDDENMKRQYETNAAQFFTNVRSVAQGLRRAGQRYLARAHSVT